MNYAPIIIPTLNRYEHLKACVESLAACTHADKTELIIGLDYPPLEKYVEGWKKVKEYVKNINGFRKVTILERSENYGAAKNSITLREYAFQYYDTCIYTEDDNVFSPCFLDYINKGLEKYKNDEKAIIVSGYFRYEKLGIKIKDCNVFKNYNDFCAWGYGTWKHKYEKFRNTIKPNYRKIVLNHNLNVLRNFYHYFVFHNLVYCLDNSALDRPCDVTYAASNLIHRTYQIVPSVPMVRNMGYDGSGENCGTLNDDIHSKRIISDQKFFDFNDKKINRYTRLINRKVSSLRNKELMIGRRAVLRFYLYLFVCVFVGFDFAEKIRHMGIRRVIKRIFKYWS